MTGCGSPGDGELVSNRQSARARGRSWARPAPLKRMENFVVWPAASLNSGAELFIQMAVAKLMPDTTAKLAGCARQRTDRQRSSRPRTTSTSPLSKA